MRANVVGAGNPMAGTTATPSPAATNPRTVIGLELDLGVEAGRPAQVEGLAAHPRGSSAHDERLGRHLGERDGIAARQRVGQADGEDEGLDEHATPLDVGAEDPVRRQLDVGGPGREVLRDPPALSDRGAQQHDPDPGVVPAEGLDQPRHEPGPEAEGEGQRHDAGLGVDELAHGREAVVEVVDERVDVPLERRPRVRHPQHPAGATQQRRADLLLQPGQGPRDARLAHAEDLADLGHRVPVGDELEPAQCIRVHGITLSHELYVWISLDAWLSITNT